MNSGSNSKTKSDSKFYTERSRSAEISKLLPSLRIRTLPLALSSIFMGNILAFSYGILDMTVAVLAVVTAGFLQILSNLANEYGDAVKGADNEDRVGPKRAIQQGLVSYNTMLKAIYVFAALSLCSGILLLIVGSRNIGLTNVVVLFIIGILAIVAAIKYTVGKKAYGYSGLGDLFVFVFFGPVGVIGTYFLNGGEMYADVFLPASAIGFLSAAVLNVNNMRDHENDRNTGKRTIVVIMGIRKAKLYHLFLAASAIICMCSYTVMNYSGIKQHIYLIVVPLLIWHVISIFRNKSPELMNKELPKLSIYTLILVLLMGVSLLI